MTTRAKHVKMIEEVGQKLIGKTVAEAYQIMRGHEFCFRVAVEDGNARAPPVDVRLNRINVAVQDGKIIRVVGYG